MGPGSLRDRPRRPREPTAATGCVGKTPSALLLPVSVAVRCDAAGASARRLGQRAGLTPRPAGRGPIILAWLARGRSRTCTSQRWRARSRRLDAGSRFRAAFEPVQRGRASADARQRNDVVAVARRDEEWTADRAAPRVLIDNHARSDPANRRIRIASCTNSKLVPGAVPAPGTYRARRGAFTRNVPPAQRDVVALSRTSDIRRHRARVRVRLHRKRSRACLRTQDNERQHRQQEHKAHTQERESVRFDAHSPNCATAIYLGVIGQTTRSP